MKGIGKLLEKKYGELIFGLLSGVGYLGIILSFILENTARGGLLLAFFFFPVIICLPALLLIKLTRNLREKENYNAINTVMWMHIILLIVSVVLMLGLIIK